MSAVSFTAYGVAQPAGSKVAGRTKSGRLFVRDAAKGSRAWKEAVAQVAGEAMGGRELLDGPLYLHVRFHLPRPKGHYGKRGLLPSAPAFPTVAPDATKLVRAVEDALQGIVYRNDAQIVTQVVFKVYDEPARVFVDIGSAA